MPHIQIDTEKMNQEIDYWNKWLNDEEVAKDRKEFNKGIHEAFNVAKMRLDIEGAKIMRPMMDQFKLWKDSKYISEECITDLYFKCMYDRAKKNTPDG